MKTTRSLLSAVVLTAALSSVLFSCMEDPGTHSSQFIYPNSGSSAFYSGYKPVYADTPDDSIVFATTEKWKLKTDFYGGSDGWLTIEPDIVEPFFKMQENALYIMSGPVYFEPNTTGRKRFVRITVDTGKYNCSGGFIQLPYLCISRPLRYVISTSTLSSLESRDSLASLVSLADTRGDSIVFKVSSDWEIVQRDNSWLHPETLKGHEGDHAVQILYDVNTTGVERYDTLFLRTKGKNSTTDRYIVDTIPFIQRATR